MIVRPTSDVCYLPAGDECHARPFLDPESIVHAAGVSPGAAFVVLLVLVFVAAWVVYR